MTAEPSYPVSATAYGQRVATYFGFAPATPAAKVGDTSRARYEAKIQSGLRNNYLITLQLIIERDPSIPSAPVPCYPGQHHWSSESGPCQCGQRSI